MRKCIFGILIFLSISSSVDAHTGAIEIREIRVESGMVYIWPTTSINNTKNCDTATPIKLDYRDLGFDQMYSQALVSFSSGAKIQFWLNSCEASPWGRTIPKAYASGLTK